MQQQPAEEGREPRLEHISTEQALQILRENFGQSGFLLIDTRTPQEFAALRLEGARLLDCYDPAMLSELDALDRGGRYLLYCRSGNRSGMVLSLMERMGFHEAYNMAGGILRWVELGLPIISGAD